MKLVKYLFFVSIFIVFTTSPIFGIKCPAHERQRVVNGSIIVVDVAERVVAPEGTALMLNSTVKRANNETICINKTMESGKSYVVRCFPPKEIKRDFEFINVFLREQDAFLVLILKKTTVSCNALYTWWSEERQTLGDTIVSIEDYNRPADVLSGRNRTTIIVHGSNPGTYVDVSMVDVKHDKDVYNYQFLGEKRRHCIFHNNDVVPLYVTPYYMSLFKSVKCPRDGHYKLSTTDMDGMTNQFNLTFHFKENISIDAIVEKNPTSIGDSTTVSCEVNDASAIITWTYHEKRIEDIAKYNVTEIISDTGLKSILSIHNVSSDDIGKYRCSLRTDCGLKKDTSVTIKIHEMENIDDRCPIITCNEGGDKVVREEISGEPPPCSTTEVKDRLEISLKYCHSFAELRCITTGNIKSVKWLQNGRPLKNNKKYHVSYEGTMLTTLTISNPLSEDAGQYECQISSENFYAEKYITILEKENIDDSCPTITSNEAGNGEVRSASSGWLPFSSISLTCISFAISKS